MRLIWGGVQLENHKTIKSYINLFLKKYKSNNNIYKYYKYIIKTKEDFCFGELESEEERNDYNNINIIHLVLDLRGGGYPNNNNISSQLEERSDGFISEGATTLQGESKEIFENVETSDPIKPPVTIIFRLYAKGKNKEKIHDRCTPLGIINIYPKKMPLPSAPMMSDCDITTWTPERFYIGQVVYAKDIYRSRKINDIRIKWRKAEIIDFDYNKKGMRYKIHYKRLHEKSDTWLEQKKERIMSKEKYKFMKKNNSQYLTQYPNIPNSFLCPIKIDIMKNPVICSDGHTYEKEFIEKWLKNNNTSPLTNKILENKNLIPNFALKKAIDEYYLL